MWGTVSGNLGGNTDTAGNLGGYTDVRGTGQNVAVYGSGTGMYMGYSGTGMGVYGAYTGISLGNAGGNATHNNMPPYCVVGFIIRYQ